MLPGAALVRRLPRRLRPSACLGLVLLPFLVAGSFPTQDGPSHLHVAGLRNLIDAGQAPVAARYLESFNPGLTNVVAPWLLSRLLEAATPLRAEWAMALGLTLLLLGAVLLGQRLLRGQPADLALGALLCAPLMLYMGSFSLVLGMACAFAALACAARLLAGGGPRHAALFLLAAALGCAANIQVAVPILAACFGGVAGAMLWRRLRGGPLAPTRREAILLAASLPVIGLALLYALSMPGGGLTAGATWSLRRQIGGVLFRSDVSWFWYTDVLLLLLLTLTLLGAAAWWAWRGAGAAPAADPAGDRQPAALWALAGALAIAGAMLVLPVDTDAAPQIPSRLAPFLHYLLFLWFVAAGLPSAWRTAVLALALAAGLSQAVTRSIAHHVIEARAAEMQQVEARIPSGTVLDVVRLPWLAPTLLQQYDAPAQRIGGFRFRYTPFVHPGRAIAGRDILDLGNYQFLPDWRIFRLRPRPALAEVTGLSMLDRALRSGSIPGGFAGHRAQLRAAIGRDLDYVIVWNSGLDAAALARTNPVVAAVLDDLRAGFELEARSAPAGYAELWRRRADPAAPQ